MTRILAALGVRHQSRLLMILVSQKGTCTKLLALGKVRLELNVGWGLVESTVFEKESVRF